MEEVFDESAHFMVSKRTEEGNGIGNKSLYEQTTDDDEYDPYMMRNTIHMVCPKNKRIFVTLWTSNFVV